MPKTNTPFFSLGSQGTVGGVLTSQKRGRDTILRETPIPTDPYSLAQAYQRWDYRDYAHLWTLLSNSEKQVYRTSASRYHITGFSQFMRESLKDLTGLIGRWRLDEKSGATAYDSSKQANNGTIIGASPATGIIAGAYYFDGINDRIFCGTNNHLTVPYSLDFFYYPQDLNTWDVLVHLAQVGNLPLFASSALNKLRIYMGVNLWLDSLKTFAAGDLSKWWHLAFLVLGDNPNTDAHIYINGALDDGATAVIGAHDLPDGNCTIGIANDLTSPFKGRLDHVSLYDYELDLPTIQRHSERRYTL